MFQIIQSKKVGSDNKVISTVMDEAETLGEANERLAYWLKYQPEIYGYQVKEIKPRGRPAKEKTKVMRIPESLVSTVKEMIHPDSNHPSKILNKPVEISILTDDGIEHETVQFQQIQWNTVDFAEDTVVISSEDDKLKVAVYSTMDLIVYQKERQQ